MQRANNGGAIEDRRARAYLLFIGAVVHFMEEARFHESLLLDLVARQLPAMHIGGLFEAA
jgi:hypothetical protein